MVEVARLDRVVPQATAVMITAPAIRARTARRFSDMALPLQLNITAFPGPLAAISLAPPGLAGNRRNRRREIRLSQTPEQRLLGTRNAMSSLLHAPSAEPEKDVHPDGLPIPRRYFSILAIWLAIFMAVLDGAI